MSEPATDCPCPSAPLGSSVPDPEYPDVLRAAFDALASSAAPAPLDPEETSSGGIEPSTPDSLDRTKEAACLAYRHGGWHTRRRLTREAFTASEASPGRLERFDACGSNAWVLRQVDDHARFRLASNRCHDRFCVPCATEHRNVVCRNLRAQCADKDLRLLTLTLRSVDRPLVETLKSLGDSWRRLRAWLMARCGLVGGVSFLEITLNNVTDLWHPHLHVLFEGRFVPVKAVSAKWLEITGDSFIVDVRSLRSSDAAAGYVAKYASKTISANVVHNPARYVEAIRALHGTRTFATFGTWTAMHLSRPPEDELGWEPVAPLHVILAKARRGDVASQLIVRSLARSDAHAPTDIDPRNESPP